jgi:hypothetical protein
MKRNLFLALALAVAAGVAGRVARAAYPDGCTGCRR